MKILPPGTFDTWWKTATAADQRRYARTIFVDMHERGFSLEQPLFTNSVANCLVIAISKKTGTSGALAHVDIAQSGFSLSKGYDTASEELAAMTRTLGGDRSKLELLLWKGSGFATSGNFYSKGSRDSFAAHLGAGHGFAQLIDHMDHARPYRTPSAVLFDPVRGIVFELSSQESDFVAENLCREALRLAARKFTLAVTALKPRSGPDNLDAFRA